MQGLLIICEILGVISATSLKLNLVHIIPIKKGIFYGCHFTWWRRTFCWCHPLFVFRNRCLKKCVLFKTRLILNEKRLFSSVFEFAKLKSFSKGISLPPPPPPPPCPVLILNDFRRWPWITLKFSQLFLLIKTFKLIHEKHRLNFWPIMWISNFK